MSFKNFINSKSLSNPIYLGPFSHVIFGSSQKQEKLSFYNESNDKFVFVHLRGGKKLKSSVQWQLCDKFAVTYALAKLFIPFFHTALVWAGKMSLSIVTDNYVHKKKSLTCGRCAKLRVGR